MLDDLLESLEIPIEPSKRNQARFRFVFGLVGTLLAVAGVYKGLVDGFGASGLAFRLAGCTVFLFMGCCCTLNVALHRTWRWPARGFVASLVALFVVRLVFGA